MSGGHLNYAPPGRRLFAQLIDLLGVIVARRSDKLLRAFPQTRSLVTMESESVIAEQ